MGNSQKQSDQNCLHPKLMQFQRENNSSLVLTPPPSHMLNDWIEKVRDFQKRAHPDHRLLIPKIEEVVGGTFCGTNITYKLIYPKFEFYLKREIMQRKPKMESFTEPQLWYLLYQILFSSYEFQKQNQKSGDVRSANVLLNADGEMLLINRLSFPDESTNYYKSLSQKQKTYLSPEELWEFQQNIKYPKCDQPTAQSFSIGMTILDAALLEDLQRLYDFKKFSFDFHTFNNLLAKFKTDKYSPFFVKTVCNLLEAKKVDRITPGEAWAIIRPYRDSILNLEQFAPDREESKKSLTAFQQLS